MLDRRTKLLHLSNARAAAGNQSLPQETRDKYQKAADHLGLSVDLENALQDKQEQEAMSTVQSPPPPSSRPTSPSPKPLQSPAEAASQSVADSPQLRPVANLLT